MGSKYWNACYVKRSLLRPIFFFLYLFPPIFYFLVLRYKRDFKTRKRLLLRVLRIYYLKEVFLIGEKY